MFKEMSENQILLYVIKNLKELRKKEFQLLIDELHPYDIANVYKNLPEKHRHKFVTFLTTRQIASLIQELESDLQMEILHKLGIERSSHIMNLMENDDLADLLGNLEVDEIQDFLASMKADESRTVQDLMQFDPDTAGGIMTNRFVWIPHVYTVRDAVEKLKTFAGFAENIYYLYVINDEKKLVGVVSYRDLLLAEMDEKIEEIMYSRVIAVPADMDQEEVARTIERYDFIAVPVLDEQERLIGIVTVDDVLDVLIEEANEDIEKLSATGKSIDFQTSALVASYRRLPWLILLLFIGILSGSIISTFEGTIERAVALTYFMPMIAGMTGNTGTQSLAVVVRGLVSHDIDRQTILKLIMREFGVGFIIGITCGLLIAIVAYLWKGNLILGLVVGSSLFFTLIIGTLAGTLIPLLLYRFKVDPAVASGPLITTLNDIFSLFVYFGTATMFITHLL